MPHRLRPGQMNGTQIGEIASMRAYRFDMSIYNISNEVQLIISLPVGTKSKPNSELTIGIITILRHILKERQTIRSKD